MTAPPLFMVLLAASAAMAAADYQYPRNTDKVSHNNTFDYVMVGGGTADLALAVRHAEDSFTAVVPGYCTVNFGTDRTDFNPLVDWGFVTEPQKALGGRRLHYTRGKTLGGTSARNWLYYQSCVSLLTRRPPILTFPRPNAGSLDKCAEIVGDDSYSFNNLLLYYKKSLQYTPPVILSANSTNDQDPGAARLVAIAVSLGMRSINSFQSSTLLGSAYLPFTIDPEKSQRSSFESSFLRSLSRNSRLHVYHHTLAEMVLLDKRNTATGVFVSSGGSSFTLNARKEVILSAGVFQSPQLLMLSGIGLAATLAKHNISLRINLPGVGSNLQDHAWFGTERRVRVTTASTLLNNASYFTSVRGAYNNHATGFLTIPATGFLAWEEVPHHLRKNLSASTCHALDTTLTADWPEMEHLPVGAPLGYQRNYQKEDPTDGYNYATVAPLLGAPLSRGTVTISSSNPADAAVIDPNYLSHPTDMQDLTIGKETLPGENVTTDAEILDYIKQSLGIAPHAVGTCRMGKKGDECSVADSIGRVYGAPRLRVVDASVFPLLPPGHIQATVYAVAEKIADAILRGF
ncbi:MAG: hypothetical protein Q9207_003246 [Kuettlingeria erythrocarpa]